MIYYFANQYLYNKMYLNLCEYNFIQISFCRGVGLFNLRFYETFYMKVVKFIINFSAHP